MFHLRLPSHQLRSGPGCGYNVSLLRILELQCQSINQIFAGKDASKGKLLASHFLSNANPFVALGKSSLDPADAISDYSELTDKELGVLDDWKAYYTKVGPCLSAGCDLLIPGQRYNVVGKLDNGKA